MDVQTLAAHEGQALEKDISDRQGDSDFGDVTITEAARGRNDQREVALSSHDSPFGGRRVARDRSLDSSYNKYLSIDSALEAVNETKTMVADVTNALDLIMQRLDYLESRLDEHEQPNQDEGDPELGDENPADKGKGIDPRNWGNVDIPNDDISKF